MIKSKGSEKGCDEHACNDLLIHLNKIMINPINLSGKLICNNPILCCSVVCYRDLYSFILLTLQGRKGKEGKWVGMSLG